MCADLKFCFNQIAHHAANAACLHCESLMFVLYLTDNSINRTPPSPSLFSRLSLELLQFNRPIDQSINQSLSQSRTINGSLLGLIDLAQQVQH